jgi:integrase/recombinase XerD
MADSVSKALAKSTAIIRLVLGKEPMKSGMPWSLYDPRGRRKYLVPRERWAFLKAALGVGGAVATFCAVLAFSGARISEALALTPERIDDANGAINFETLKRRQRGVIRAVPVPRNLFVLLDAVHGYRAAQVDPLLARKRLWPWSRTTAWRRVKEVMRLARQPDHIAMPKALRHAFGAGATLESVSPTLIQRWMGHARIETTLIYTSLIGKEERSLARITWRGATRGFRR